MSASAIPAAIFLSILSVPFGSAARKPKRHGCSLQDGDLQTLGVLGKRRQLGTRGTNFCFRKSGGQRGQHFGSDRISACGVRGLETQIPGATGGIKLGTETNKHHNFSPALT